MGKLLQECVQNDTHVCLITLTEMEQLRTITFRSLIVETFVVYSKLSRAYCKSLKNQGEYIGGWYEKFLQSQQDGTISVYRSYFKLIELIGGSHIINDYFVINVPLIKYSSSDFQKMHGRKFHVIKNFIHERHVDV